MVLASGSLLVVALSLGSGGRGTVVPPPRSLPPPVPGSGGSSIGGTPGTVGVGTVGVEGVGTDGTEGVAGVEGADGAGLSGGAGAAGSGRSWSPSARLRAPRSLASSGVARRVTSG